MDEAPPPVNLTPPSDPPEVEPDDFTKFPRGDKGSGNINVRDYKCYGLIIKGHIGV
jgi:hypothetical protein